MASAKKEWRVRYYCTVRGDSPPLDYIGSLNKADQATVAHTVELLRAVGLELARTERARRVEGPIWELRPMPHRLLYYAGSGRVFWILHAFRKKSGKTRRRDIDTAERRMREIQEREAP